MLTCFSGLLHIYDNAFSEPSDFHNMVFFYTRPDLVVFWIKVLTAWQPESGY